MFHGFSRKNLIVAASVPAVVLGVVAWIALAPKKVSGATAEQRIESIHRLTRDGSPSAARAIAAAANDPDPAVRRVAVAAVSTIQADQGRVLATGHLNDPDPQVRASSAAALGCQADAGDVAKLVAALSTESDRRAREGIIIGLNRAGTPQATVAMVRAMEYDPALRPRVLGLLMSRFGASMGSLPPIEDQAAWSKLIAAIRRSPTIREAFSAAGEAP